MTVLISGCRGCGACLLTCPEHAIRPAIGGGFGGVVPPGQHGGGFGGVVPPGQHGGLLRVLAERCTGCGECAEICPADAITVTGQAAR